MAHRHAQFIQHGKAPETHGMHGCRFFNFYGIQGAVFFDQQIDFVLVFIAVKIKTRGATVVWSVSTCGEYAGSHRPIHDWKLQ